MTSRGKDYYQHTTVIVVDANTLRHGAGVFVREVQGYIRQRLSGAADGYTYSCSECEYELSSHGKPSWKYCPSCGAKFEGKCPHESVYGLEHIERDGYVWCRGVMDEGDYLHECKRCPQWDKGDKYREWHRREVER